MTLLVTDDHEPPSGGGFVGEAAVDISSFRAASRGKKRAETDVAVTAHVERRLAAILAADIAGYSRLVGADEHGTLLQWHAH